MRYSRPWLACKYANRSANFGRAVLAGIVALMFLSWSLLLLVHDLRLSVFGETTQGTVVSKQLGRGGKRPNTHFDYSFDVNGRTFRGQFSASPADGNAINVGQAIDVVYLASNPAVNRSGFPLWQTGLLIPIAIGTVAAGLALWYFVQGVRDIAARVRRIAYGSPALGRVDAVEIGRGRRGRTFVKRLAYHYFVRPSPGCIDMEVTDLTQLEQFLPRDLVVGAVILVVHDPDNPKSHEIDRFDARQSDRVRLLGEIA